MKLIQELKQLWTALREAYREWQETRALLHEPLELQGLPTLEVESYKRLLEWTDQHPISPVVVGQTGIGKTAVAEQVALRRRIDILTLARHRRK